MHPSAPPLRWEGRNSERNEQMCEADELCEWAEPYVDFKDVQAGVGFMFSVGIRDGCVPSCFHPPYITQWFTLRSYRY